MEAKKKAIGNRQKAIGQAELLAALMDAGYTIDGAEPKGNTLVVRLVPAYHGVDKKNTVFPALSICNEMELQARCNVFAAVPEDILILSVKLPEEKLSADSSQPSAKEEPSDS